MYVMKQIGPESFSAAAPLEGFEAVAATPAAAAEQLMATIKIQRFVRGRMAALKAATVVKFDPRVRAYVANCPAAGIAATGMTRQDAFDRLIKAVHLAEEARAARAAEETQGQDTGETGIATTSPETETK